MRLPTSQGAWFVYFGWIAMAAGPFPTLMAWPGLLVAVLIGVTVPL